MGRPSLPGPSTLPGGPLSCASESCASGSGCVFVVAGLQPPMGDSGMRSDCVATMDMLNDMFQRQAHHISLPDCRSSGTHAYAFYPDPNPGSNPNQARRLESQLYQRAQDARTIETVQKQEQETAQQVRSLERYQVEQAARITQSTEQMEALQQQMRAASREHEMVLSTCEALQEDADQLRRSLEQEDPQSLEGLELEGSSTTPIAELRQRASQLEASVAEAEKQVSMHIASTPSTMAMMAAGPHASCNPLDQLSAVADTAPRNT